MTMPLFSKIGYRIKSEPRIKQFNPYMTSNDFDTKKQLFKAIKRYMQELPCPECGYKGCTGDYVAVHYAPVQLYQEEYKKGFFGGLKEVPAPVNWSTGSKYAPSDDLSTV